MPSDAPDDPRRDIPGTATETGASAPVTLRCVDVILAFEDPLLLAGARATLEAEAGCRVVGCARTPADVRGSARTGADVFVFDMALEARDPGLLSFVLATSYAPVAIYVTHTAEECVLRSPAGCRLGGVDCCLASLARGARGCIPRDAEPGQFVAVVRAVADGDIAALPWLDAAARGGMESGRAISTRELEVIQQVASGASNKEIARRLGIHQQTVKNHLANIARKTGLSSRVELALFAMRHGLVRTPAAHARRDERGEPARPAPLRAFAGS